MARPYGFGVRGDGYRLDDAGHRRAATSDEVPISFRDISHVIAIPRLDRWPSMLLPDRLRVVPGSVSNGRGLRFVIAVRLCRNRRYRYVKPSCELAK
jgi:hypothetical protein